MLNALRKLAWVRDWPLRYLLVGLVLLLVAGALLPSVAALLLLTESPRTELLQARMALAGEQGSAAIERRLHAVLAYAQHLGTDYPELGAYLRVPDVAARADLERRLLLSLLEGRHLASAFVLTRSGGVVLGVGKLEQAERLAATPAFRRAIAGHPALTEVLRDRTGKHPTYAAMAPVRANPGGPVLGVAVLADRLDGVIGTIVDRGAGQVAPGSFWVLVDAPTQGEGPATEALHPFPLTPAEREALAQRAGVHLTRLEHQPWGLSVVVPVEVARARRWEELGWGAVLVLMGLGTVYLLARVFARRLLRALVALQRVALRWRRGDLAARAPVEGCQEVTELATAFNLMAEELQERTASLQAGVRERTYELLVRNEALRESRRRLARTQAIAGIGTWEVDIESDKWTGCAELFRMLELNPSALPSKDNWIEAMPLPEDRRRYWRMIEAALAGRQGLADEVRLVLPSGAEKVFRMQVEAVLDPTGRPERLVSTMQDVTHQKRLEEALRAQHVELRELDGLKTRLINAVSHDLRGPASSVRGYADFLLAGLGGPLTAEQRAFVERILRGSLQLEHLIDDLLELALLEAGAFRLALAEGDLGQVIREAAEGLAPLAVQKHLEVAFDLPPALPVASFDARRIERVVVNLLQNALKFTPEGGRVRVQLWREGDGLRCEVEDTGPGIAPQDLPKLFRHFSELGTGQGQGGLGLGLSICKAVVEAHGGDIGVRSTPDEGATFWFWLPLAPQEPRAV
ncbi:HAMP domain-containing protein [bacterium]|nr:HAMP domain-containing protein [bacterium]